MPPVPRVFSVIGAIGAIALAAAVLTGCGGSGEKPRKKQEAPKGASVESVAVAAGDTTCEVAKRALPAGIITLNIENKGTKVTEVYVYTPDNRVVTERENIKPGAKADLVVELREGRYQIACKPGMKGTGIRQDITVSGTAAAAADPRLRKAVEDYRAYVAEQVDDSIAKTKDFVAAVKNGDVAKAKDLYAPSRVGWERIEPVAEAFGEIDPKVDLREKDLEQGQTWTGWHRLEKALWKAPSTLADEAKYADQLLTDLGTLKGMLPTADITASSMANGAKELLDEVAEGKVTGEEEAFSHTDLWDFKANVDGAQKVFELLKPVLTEKNAALSTTLEAEFARLGAVLGKYTKGEGFVDYSTVDQARRKELATAVNALGEPLAGLANAVVR